MKNRYIKMPPQLTDGEHWVPCDDPLDIGDAIMRWMRDQPVGQRVTLEIIEMEPDAVEGLPSI